MGIRENKRKPKHERERKSEWVRVGERGSTWKRKAIKWKETEWKHKYKNNDADDRTI